MLMHGVSLGYEYSVISGKASAFIVNVLIVFSVHLTLEKREAIFSPLSPSLLPFQLQRESLKPCPSLILAKSGKKRCIDLLCHWCRNE